MTSNHICGQFQCFDSFLVHLDKPSKGEKQRGKQSEENIGQQLQYSFALLEHFPKSIFYMLYTISQEVKNPTLLTVYDLELK